ncbi:MAG: CHAT domain-containing protein [Methylococcales bacterium]|nr:CHAT domain-containing protein [Methylococcales bacterium]
MNRFRVWIIATGLWAGVVHSADFENIYQQGKNRLAQEQYSLAIEMLNDAQQLASTLEQQAQILGTLGLTYYRMQRWEQATKLLRDAVALNVGEKADRARWLGTLADLEAEKGKPETARPLYEQALSLAENDAELVTGLRFGKVKTLPLAEQLTGLKMINDSLDAVVNPETRSRLLINSGEQAHKLGANGLELAFKSFEQARRDGENKPRLQVEATGQLAQLYEEQTRFDEALRLNSQAINVAKKVDAHDLLLELEWRQGRLQRSLQHLPEATAAYQQAIEHIEAIRQDIPVEYHNGRSSFREILEPVYLGLADLLLMQASQKSGDDKNVLLRHARATVELIKQSEIEDFLGGRCAVHGNKNALLEAVEPTTAIIYPILLPDRLEILVSSGNEIRQYTQPVEAAAVQDLTKHLAHSLRVSKYDVKTASQQLYQWLIAPVEPWLKTQHIKTLVMVPDGVLRLIPPAVLYDGQHYLIENYAVAISPGLTLFEPAPLQQRGIKALLAGMSEPGSVVEHLPPIFLQALTDSRGVENFEDMSEVAVKSRQLEMERMIKEPVFRQHLKEQLSLPGVAEEINSLQKEIPNTALLNEAFTVEGFKHQAIQEPYSVVHIASHGVFGKTADASFVMAYDDVINMNDLDRLLKSDKFAKQPVELLTLSACQTAEGDDRAPLGLSGIALKAKVRSVLGTLWPVSDEAASLLMDEFYKALSQPNTSKVQALRQAQIKLLKQKDLENPFYWSPFILAGSWL